MESREPNRATTPSFPQRKARSHHCILRPSTCDLLGRVWQQKWLWPLRQPTTRCENRHFSAQKLSLDHTKSSNFTTYCRLSCDRGKGGIASPGPNAPLSRLDCSRHRSSYAESCPITRQKLPEGWQAYNSSCKASRKPFQFIAVQSRREVVRVQLVSQLSSYSVSRLSAQHGAEKSKSVTSAVRLRMNWALQNAFDWEISGVYIDVLPLTPRTPHPKEALETWQETPSKGWTNYGQRAEFSSHRLSLRPTNLVCELCL
jgi:hypothetical protein